MAARFSTLKEIDQAGFDLRIWCYACEHCVVLDGILWSELEERGRSIDINQVRGYLRCSCCGARDSLVLPATSTSWRPKDAKSVAVTWFFANRSVVKTARGGRSV